MTRGKLKKILCAAAVLVLLAPALGATSVSSGEFVVSGGVLTQYIGTAADVVVPGNLGITEIGARAFEANDHIASVTLPDTVQVIGESAFSSCTHLQSVTIPAGVTSIGDDAFFHCYELSDLTLPEGLRTLGNFAFCGSGISSLRLPRTLAAVGDYAFCDCDGLRSVEIPYGVRSIGIRAFGDCDALESVTLPDSVRTLEQLSFAGCGALKSVRLSAGLDSVGSRAFSWCSALQAVEIPYGVDKIGYAAFYGCGSLRSLELPGTVTEIGEEAFGYCPELASVTIPDSVTVIGDDCFANSGKAAVYGSSGSCAEAYAVQSGISFVPVRLTGKFLQRVTAVPTSSRILVDGVSVSCQAYTIGGYNYFKLRDLAAALSGTGRQFEVSWDGAKNAISLTSGQVYTTVGGELSPPASAARTGVPCLSAVTLDGSPLDLLAYTIGENNYFRLRGLAAALDFGVTWDGNTNTILIDTGMGYTE